MNKQKVVIIGAGYGGLALANILAKADYDVHVYEKEPTAGGRTGILRQDGFTFDTGPSWYLMPEAFDHYYGLLGTSTKEQLDLVRLSPGYKVFFEDEPSITIAGSLDTDAATFEAIEPGAGQRLRDYVAESKAIYELSLKHFLYTNYSRLTDLAHPAILRRALRMLVLAFRPLHTHVKKVMTNSRLQKILEYHMVFLGSSPFQAPAIYSLMSMLDFKSGVFYPQGGMYTLIESLKRIGEELGVQYHFNAPVEHIEAVGTRATGIRLTTGNLVTADLVISNADLHFTETKLLDKEHVSYPAKYWSRIQPGPSALLISLGISGSLPTLLHHNLLFVKDWRENFKAIYEDRFIPETASMYVCNPNKTDPTVAPIGFENIFMLVPLPAGVAVDEAYQAELVERFLVQFETMANIPDLRQRIVSRSIFGPNDFMTKYFSWQSGALGGPSHLLRQSAIFRTPNKSKKLANLYYVGAGTTPGIGLPMCLMSAELVYKRLADDKKGGRVTTIRPIGRLKP